MPQETALTVAVWGMRSFIQRIEWCWGVACCSPRLVGELNLLALTCEVAPSLAPTTVAGEGHSDRETVQRRASASLCWLATWVPRAGPREIALASDCIAHPLLPSHPRRARECHAPRPAYAVEVFPGIRQGDARDSRPVPARYARCARRQLPPDCHK